MKGISDKVVAKLQTYFNKAIRDNKGNLQKMKNQDV